MDSTYNYAFQLIKRGIHRPDMYPGWGPGMRNCYVIHYVISGTGHFEINGNKYTIHAGESFLIPPYTTIHYYPDDVDRWLYTWIDFSGNWAAEFFTSINWTATTPVCHVPLGEVLMPHFQRLTEIHVYTDNRNEASGILHTILGIYADAMMPSSNMSDNKQRLSDALQIIHANYFNTTLSVNTLCDTLNISSPTLYRLFMNHMGMSPHSYIQFYRIEQAKKMLEASATVKATASSCGYENALYFSRAFKKMVGCSPTQYLTGK